MLSIGFWSVLLLIVICDLRWHRIPKHLNYLLLIMIAAFHQNLIPVMLLIWSGYGILALISRGAIGYGDVRLAPCLAVVSGSAPFDLVELLAPHLLAWTLGGIFVALSRSRRDEALPMAPFYALATLIMSANLN